MSAYLKGLQTELKKAQDRLILFPNANREELQRRIEYWQRMIAIEQAA